MFEELQIDEISLRNELRPYEDKPYEALFEYIWNSFDANATKVEITYTIPEAGYITSLTIQDDGMGWDFRAKNTNHFLSSLKSDEREMNKTLPHGKWGRGRYVFIWFADLLTAESNQQKLTLESNTKLNITSGNYVSPGTRVVLSGIHEVLNNALVSEEGFREFLVNEYCWFLAECPERQIILNGKSIDYRINVKQEKHFTLHDFSEDLAARLDPDTEVRIILWATKPKEFAKFYFINSINKELFTESTKLNKKKDSFWHSVYISSEQFHIDSKKENDEQVGLFGYKNEAKLKRDFLDEIRQKLAELRRPILATKSKEIVKEIMEQPSFPRLEELGVYDKGAFSKLLEHAFVIAPAIFTGKSPQERAFVSVAFAGILSSQDDNLVRLLLSQLQQLTPQEEQDLRTILKKTTLANMVRTVKEVEARLSVIDDLNALLFEQEKYTKEVVHLQQVLNLNPWIFGEQYRLFANTEGALRNTLLKYATSVLGLREPAIETTSRRELDLFLVKSLSESEKQFSNIIVEIKRPSVKLGKAELDQIKDYATTILKEPICNGETMYWDFYLVGNSYDDYIEGEIESQKNWGEKQKGLVYNRESSRLKIYVRKWSDILHVELGHKMKYLKDGLALKASEIEGRNPDEVVQSHLSNSTVLTAITS